MGRDGLIAGDYPTKSQEITVTGPAEFRRGDVVAAKGGEFALVDPEGEGGAELAIGIICDDVAVGDGESARAAMYVKGEFSQRALRFGGGGEAEPHLRRMTEIGLIVRPTRV